MTGHLFFAEDGGAATSASQQLYPGDEHSRPVTGVNVIYVNNGNLNTYMLVWHPFARS